MRSVKTIALGVVFFLLISAIYWDLPKTFFQQDEWSAFGNYIFSEGIGGFWKVMFDSVGVNASVHLVPLTVLSFFLQFKLFQFNFFPYAVLSIIGHASITLLFFYLTFLVTKNKIISFSATLIFGLGSISSQSVTWIAASVITQPAAFFSLLSMIFFFHYTQSKKSKYMVYSLLAIIIGLFFKESIFFLFFFLPIVGFIYKKKDRSRWIMKNTLLPLSIFFVAYVLLRIVLFVAYSTHFQVVSPIEVSMRIPEYIARVFLLPFRVIPQSLIPMQFLLFLSGRIIGLLYPFTFDSGGSTNPYIVESIGLDMVCLIIGIFIVIFTYISYKNFLKSKDLYLSKGVLFSFWLLVFSSLPFVLIPGKAGFVSIIEPRNLYISTMGSSMLLSILLYGIAKKIFTKSKLRNCFVFVLIIPILFAHYKLINGSLTTLIVDSSIRKSIIASIQERYPELPNRAIFYFESDRSYYGLADKILPFQSGLGEILLVVYKIKGQDIPICFFEDQRFYDLLYQGYEECGGRGFGYFRNKDLLTKEVSDKKIEPKDIIAFQFLSFDNSLKEISREVQAELTSSSFEE